MGEVNSAGSSRLLSKIVHSKSNKDDFGIYSLKCIASGLQRSTGKGIVLQAWGPEFNPQNPPPKKTKQNKTKQNKTKK